MTQEWERDPDQHYDVMPPLSEQQRSKILDEELFWRVRNGARVLARTATAAVVETGKPVNHILHLLASVFLCGLWLPVWVLITATGGTFSRTLSVDENGGVHDSHHAWRERMAVPNFMSRRELMIWIGVGVAVFLVAYLLHLSGKA